MLDPALLDGGIDAPIQQISAGFSSSDFDNVDVFVNLGGESSQVP